MARRLYDSSVGEDVASAIVADGIEYAIFPGRRAPMHIVHKECAQEIFDAGLKLIVLNGSTNTPDHRLYDPLATPLTFDQQSEQFRQAFPEQKDIIFMPMGDVGDANKWSATLAETLNNPVKLSRLGLDITGGIADKTVSYFRDKEQDAAKAGDDVKPMDATSAALIEQGISPWKSFNKESAHDDISATPFRRMEVSELRENKDGILTAPEYIASLIEEARKDNPDANLLEENGIPATMLDLTFDRLRKEAGISTKEIIEIQQERGEITSESLSELLKEIFEARKNGIAEQNIITDKLHKATGTVSLKVASASLNQTVQNFTRNVPNIKSAIDCAAEDSADVLSLQELGLASTLELYLNWYLFATSQGK